MEDKDVGHCFLRAVLRGQEDSCAVEDASQIYSFGCTCKTFLDASDRMKSMLTEEGYGEPLQDLQITLTVGVAANVIGDLCNLAASPPESFSASNMSFISF